MLTYPEEVQKGDTLRLVGVIPSTNWKGELQLKVDPYARVEKADHSEEGDIGLFDFRARWNVVGRVAYTTFKSGIGKTGKPMIIDKKITDLPIKEISKNNFGKDVYHQFIFR